MNAYIKQHTFTSRLAAGMLMVTFIASCFPMVSFADTLVSADIKVNGSDGPVTIQQGDSFTYSWSSSNSSSCQMTSPINGSITLSGTGSAIDPSSPFYPTASAPTILTIECSDGTNTTSDAVSVALAAAPVTTLAVDVKANGSDGPVALSQDQSLTLTWTSTGATSCQSSSPQIALFSSGVEANGSSGTINPGHPFYPQSGQNVTYTIECSNGTSSVSDSVQVSLAATSTGTTTPSNLPVVDVKANGSDGPVTIANGTSFTYSWSSSNASSCQMTSPVNGSITLSGVSSAVDPSSPFYPATSSPTIITVECSNGTNTTSDAVSIVLGTSNGTTTPPTGNLPIVDVKANGSDGPVTVTHGNSFTYSWSSSNSSSCQMTSPINGSITLSGTSSPVNLGDTFYPADNSSIIITVECSNSTNTASDAVVVTVVPVNNGGGGCPVPVFTSPLTASVVTGTPFTYTFSFASSSQANTTFDFASTSGTSSLPTGFEFSTTTNTISGTTTVAGTYNVSFTAVNPCGPTTNTLVITITNPNGGGNPGGGGGGGGGGSSGGSSGGVVLSSGGSHSGYTPAACLYLHDYMRIDFVNDPAQVMLLQSFLKDMQGYQSVSVTGTFDQATFDAVSAFQTKYSQDILVPWGLTGPTGYVYILTLKKINEIYCQSIFPLNDAQKEEIIAYKALMDSLHAQGIYPAMPGDVVGQGGSDTEVTPPIVGTATSTPQGQNISSLAASIFAMPKTLAGFFQCLWEFLLIIVVLYILASVLEDVLYSDLPENMKKRFFTKWGAVSIGLIAAIVIAWILKEWCIILPLAIALLISLLIMAFYPKHDTRKVVIAEPKTPTTPSSTTTVVAPVKEMKTEKVETKTEVKATPKAEAKAEAPKTQGSVAAFMTAPEVKETKTEAKTEVKTEAKEESKK